MSKTPIISPTPPREHEIRTFLKRHDLTHSEFAAHMGASRDAVTKWLSGERQPLPMLERAMRDLALQLTRQPLVLTDVRYGSKMKDAGFPLDTRSLSENS